MGGRGKPRSHGRPVAGGGLIALVGWRSIFLVNLPIGLTGLWLTWRYADETAPSPNRELDFAGQAAAIGALGCVAAAIIEGGVSGWSNPLVLAGFAVSGSFAALFLLQERRARQPMLPLALFGHRLFSLMSFVGVLVNVAFYGPIFVLSLYFQQVNGFSALATGLAFLPMLGAVLPANLFLLAARAGQRFGAPPIIAAGALIAAAGCVALIGIDRGTSYWAMYAQLVAMGAGLGLLVPPLTSTLLGSVEKTRSGIAAGVLNSARQTGSVLGSLCLDR
jgi:MFS transporter, DHA2 family, methylenomycin A resistance protein